MSKKKKKTLIEQLYDITENLRESFARWCEIRDKGCNDPCWEDGSNMNLVHNHIIYYKKQLEELLKDNFLMYPLEFYIPVPPVVPNDYMRFDSDIRGYGKGFKSTYERDKYILDMWGYYEYCLKEEAAY